MGLSIFSVALGMVLMYLLIRVFKVF